MRHDDLLITLAYFSIPIQLLISLYYYPLLKVTPKRFLALIVLFALFIMLCGVGHLLRAFGKHGDCFELLNGLTAAISVTTALYLIPMIPNIMATIENALAELKMKEELEEIKNRKLMTFIGFLCHEVRNPLFAITSSIAFMKEGGNERDRVNCLCSIEQSANLMLRLVNDVLDISKLESGKVELELKGFNVLDLLNGISASIQTQVRHMRGATVTFASKISENVPAVIETDPARLLQIVYNLLSNASKFTEKGKIDFMVDVVRYDEAFGDDSLADETVRRFPIGDEPDFSVQLLASDDQAFVSGNRSDQHVLKIVVADTGCGIAPDRVNDIFRPFNQSKVADFRKFGGTGLGLSIIAQLVKVMSGKIQVDSRQNEGSTFTVYLPVLTPTTLQPPPALDTESILHDSIKNSRLPPMLINEESMEFEEGMAHQEALSMQPSTRDGGREIAGRPKNNRVLVVDDNTVNRKILGRMLASFHLDVEFATNGQEAVDVLASTSDFGLVLMDLDMPVLDGISATRVIRRDLGLTDLPIIALTAFAVQTQAHEALDAGVTEFATKPILKEDLRQKCCRYLLNRTDEIV
jgi:two-component system chemotaxis sensor kinase CheA